MLLVIWTPIVLAGVGTLLALLFTLAYDQVVPRSWLRLPAVCDVQGHMCGDVLDSKYARMLGLRNSVYGLVYYPAWIVVALRTPFSDLGCWAALLAATLGAFAMSAYLAWALLARMKVACWLCFVGHAINTALVPFAATFFSWSYRWRAGT